MAYIRCFFTVCLIITISKREYGVRSEYKSTELTYPKNDPNACVDENGNNASCVGLLACPITLQKFINGPTSDDFKYFEKIRCGFEKTGDPKVCCPVDNTTPSPPTTSPSTTLSMTTSGTASTSETTQKAIVQMSVTSMAELLDGRLGQENEVDSLATQEECMETRYFHVTNGNDTSLGEYPFMALLWRNKTLDCGAALISHRYVLTAAHCVDTLTAVRLGEWRVNTTQDCDENDVCADPVKDISVDRVIVHEEFNNVTYHNDIALIRLSERVEYTKWIKPICVPRFRDQKGVNLVGRTVTVAGWGRLRPDSFTKPDVLQKGYVKIFHEIACNSAYGVQLRNTQLCAGSDIGIDTCKGDSGGPVIVKQGGFPPYLYVGGIVSLGYILCGTKEFPAVYTNVAPYVNWIEKHVNS